MRAVGPALEFRMELTPHIPWVVLDLHDLHQCPIRRSPGQRQAVRPATPYFRLKRKAGSAETPPAPESQQSAALQELPRHVIRAAAQHVHLIGSLGQPGFQTAKLFGQLFVKALPGFSYLLI